jgi:hypothetical protein
MLTLESCKCFVFVEVPHHIFVQENNNNSQTLSLHLKTKMEPVYSLSNSKCIALEAIRLHCDYHVLTLTLKQKECTAQLYSQMKRCLSHKGFSDYFKPIRRLGKGAFATVYLV